MQDALDTPRTIAGQSGNHTYYTYDTDGNRMTVAPDEPTAINNVNANPNVNPNPNVKKAVVDGKLIIVKGDVQFNAAGAQVQ